MIYSTEIRGSDIDCLIQELQAMQVLGSSGFPFSIDTFSLSAPEPKKDFENASSAIKSNLYYGSHYKLYLVRVG